MRWRKREREIVRKKGRKSFPCRNIDQEPQQGRAGRVIIIKLVLLPREAHT